MTKGSPLRLIIFFTIPVLLGNIFQNVYNLMDSSEHTLTKTK